MGVRKASLEDVETIADMWKEFMQEHDEIVLKENPKLKSYIARHEKAANDYMEFVQGHINSESGEVIVVEIEDEIVGYTLIFVKDEIPIFETKKLGYISDLYVRKEFRGKKISSKLLDEAIKWFKNKGLNQVSVGMYPDNKFAHSVYKKWGFFDYHLDMRRDI